MQMMLFSRDEAHFSRGNPINSCTHIPFPVPQPYPLILMSPYFLTKTCVVSAFRNLSSTVYGSHLLVPLRCQF